MNGGRVFLDTNIFVYMYDVFEPQKKEISLSLLDANDCVASTQVVNEINSVLTRKIKAPIQTVKQILEDVYRVSEVKNLNKATIFQALNLMEKYGYSYYDGLMLASALESGCEILFSEDMNDGQIIEDKLKIINPYKSA
jgi:predicted nucleic acid-binding protein